jgi:CRP/FNR family transcriptional regulator, cyclic AMP receptor protein
MNGIDGAFARRAKAVLDLTNDRLDHMVTAAGLDPATDLRYGNWRGFDLSGADLRGFNFTGADLTDARFDNAFIAGAIFDHTTYDPTSLRKAADYEEFLRHTTRASLAAKPVSRTRELLQNIDLFSKLSPKHIERLSACIVGKSVARATSIFAKGDPGSSLFAICQGTVKISTPSVDGHDAMFNLMGKGDIFGEIALLDGRPRSADAIAVTDCELLVIERRDFLPLIREEPDIALKMIEVLCARLRPPTEQAGNLMFLHLPGRLAKALLRLSDGDTRTCQRRAIVTRKYLGNIIGISRERISRRLRIWEEQGWVRLERGGIVILSTKALERIAESDAEDRWSGLVRSTVDSCSDDAIEGSSG